LAPELNSGNKAIIEIIEKKIEEIVKEDKLMRDRYKELAVQISKRFKDIATNGL